MREAPLLARDDQGKKMRRREFIAATAALLVSPRRSRAQAVSYNGKYTGVWPSSPTTRMSIDIVGGRGKGVVNVRGRCDGSFSIEISVDGDITGEGVQCLTNTQYSLRGHAEGKKLNISFIGIVGASRSVAVIFTRTID
jgi:hypothetical protein